MTSLLAVPQLDEVTQLEVTDRVQGGPGGKSNEQAQQLLNRTAYLHQAVQMRAEAATQIVAGDGLEGGGDLSADRTLSMAPTGVAAAQYGSNLAVPVLTVNALGQITAVAEAPIAGIGTAWHPGNDGAGSGLDADTLDGLEAESFSVLTFINEYTKEQRFNLTDSVGQFRLLRGTGNPGVIFRMDGLNFHLLLTNEGDAYGNWNSLRPLSIDVSTGDVSFGSAPRAAGHVVWHRGNQGPGSGLNADMVDGVEATALGRIGSGAWVGALDDATAAAAGVNVGELYHSSGVVKVRLA